MNQYILENEKEFQRLEKQSRNEAYNFSAELRDFHPKPGGEILDAGCGSGVVTRYLAHFHPHSKVMGCDFSKQRIDQAKSHSQIPANASFQVENLSELSFMASRFDGVVCRYVLEHMNQADADQVLTSLYRCMRPTAQICAIDMDGLVCNLFPQSEFLEKTLAELQRFHGLDLYVGRKLPSMLERAGFQEVSWRIETLQFHGQSMKDEARLIEERFELAMPLFIRIFGGADHATRFVREYIDHLKKPSTVLFYNKFIVSAVKRALKIEKGNIWMK